MIVIKGKERKYGYGRSELLEFAHEYTQCYQRIKYKLSLMKL